MVLFQDRMPSRITTIVCAAGLLTATVEVSALEIVGGPSYDETTVTGYRYPAWGNLIGQTASDGSSVISVDKSVGGVSQGKRAVRWGPNTPAAVELGAFGVNNNGIGYSNARAMNAAGTAVGEAHEWDGDAFIATRALRWDAGSTVPTILRAPSLSATAAGPGTMGAMAISNSGIIAGQGYRDSNGDLAVIRWSAGSTVGIELASISVNANGNFYQEARGLNDAGTIVGHAWKFNAADDLGQRAVRWDTSRTTATELGHLGANLSGVTYSGAHAINNAGTVIGYAEKYDGNRRLGISAVRWDAGATAATELIGLGASPTGEMFAGTRAINDAGTIIGHGRKYENGIDVGIRAMRWDPGSTSPIELGHLGTNNSGFTDSYAYAINSAGLSVGSAARYGANVLRGQRALLWGLDGSATDLNALLIPADAAYWRLEVATGITDTNWITGVGFFDPDAAGPMLEYQRMFLIQVPEPASIAVATAAAVVIRHRRRRAWVVRQEGTRRPVYLEKTRG